MFDFTQTVSVSLFLNVAFYVDIKSNLMAMLASYSLSYFWLRPNTKLYDLSSEIVLDSILALFFSLLTLVISAIFLSHSTRLNKRIRIQMIEYLNLLNRVNEGVIVLTNETYEETAVYEIEFCSQEAVKILRPTPELNLMDE